VTDPPASVRMSFWSFGRDVAGDGGMVVQVQKTPVEETSGHLMTVLNPRNKGGIMPFSSMACVAAVCAAVHRYDMDVMKSDGAPLLTAPISIVVAKYLLSAVLLIVASRNPVGCRHLIR